jgi:hypothetical protein
MGKGGGGAAPSGPQQTTAYQTNIPEYAEPYVRNMLQATEAQVYGPGKTGFREYTPYSDDPTKYFAGPSSLQQSTYNQAAGMQTPGQYAPATGMVGLAGLGQLGAGGAYQQMATDPRAVQSYMSPFAQNVMDIQKQAAMREAQIGNVGNKLAAARQGTYGGARETLGRLEREKNLQSRLGEIQATGSQQAYDRAMQNMQFGSNLGLQGLAGASQTAGTLAGIGSQQQQSDLARINAQNTLGQQQQQYQQGIINQAIQDYATKQQYPMMQLGFMSNMLRGLPLQAATTQSYMPAPNLTTQAISGLGTAAGAYKAFGFKEGGAVPGYAGPEGSAVEMGMKAKLEALADTPDGLAQVVQIAQSSPSLEQRKLANEVLLDKEQEKRAAAQAEQSIAQDQNMGRGLANAPAPVLDTMSAAGGGIVAFAGEGESLVEDDEYTKYITAVQNMRAKAGIEGSPIDPKLKAMYEERIAGLGGRRESDTGLNMIDFFSRMNKPGSTLSAGIAAAGEALPGITARRKEFSAEELAATKGMSDLTLAERAEMLGISKEAMALRDKELDRKKALEVARIGATQRPTDLDRTTQAFLDDLIAKGAPNSPATKAQARKLAIAETGLAGPRAAGAQEDRITKAWKDIDDEFFVEELKAVTPEEKKAVAAKKQAAKDEAAKRLRTVTPTSTDPNTAVPTDPNTAVPKKNDKVALAPPPAPKIATVDGAPEGSKIGTFVNGRGYQVLDKGGKVIGYAQPN